MADAPETPPEGAPADASAKPKPSAEQAARAAAREALRRRLRTPKAQLALLGLLLLGSAPIALLVGLNRPWFESLAREKYAAATPAAMKAARAIADGAGSAETVRELSGEDRDGLYREWFRQVPEVAGPVDGVRADELPPEPAPPLLKAEVLGPLLFEVDPGRYAELIERTLLTGSPAQRERALELARTAPGCQPLIRVLEFCVRRARRTKDPDLERLRLALRGVADVHSSG